MAAYLKGPPVQPIRGHASCEGKIPFDGPQLAAKAASRRGNRDHYRCSICCKWHVGTAIHPATVRSRHGKTMVKREIELVGRLARWWVDGPTAIVVKVQRCGVIKAIAPGGDCTVEVSRAVDPQCPAQDEGRLLQLMASTWRVDK